MDIDNIIKQLKLALNDLGVIDDGVFTNNMVAKAEIKIESVIKDLEKMVDDGK